MERVNKVVPLNAETDIIKSSKRINAPLHVSQREKMLMKEAIPSSTHITPAEKLRELRAATEPLKISPLAKKLIDKQKEDEPLPIDHKVKSAPPAPESHPELNAKDLDKILEQKAAALGKA